MSLKSKLSKIAKGKNIILETRDNIVFVNGTVKNHDEWISLGLAIGQLKGVEGVVNNAVWNELLKSENEKRNYERSKIFDSQKGKERGSYDIVIIGSGVIGCFIARELSKYQDSVLVLEKGSDIGLGASRANNGMIHPGISPGFNTIKRKLNIRGNKLYDRICSELDVPFKRVGSLILITSRTLERYKKKIPNFLYRFILKAILPILVTRKGRKNGIKNLKVIRGEKVFQLEPWATKEALLAIYIPSTGILDPYELTIALSENAMENGVKLMLNTEVVGFNKTGKKITGVVTSKGLFHCKLVINAAGVYSDEIAELAGAREFTIHPRKGVEILFNKNIKPGVNHCLAELTIPTSKTSKGGGINPAIHGNIIIGPTAVEITDRTDTTVTREEITMMLEKYSSILDDDFPKKKIIRYFAGVRAPTFTEDFIIRPAKWVDNLIHVAGIQSPGLASAPAIAEHVVNMVQTKGFSKKANGNHNPKRKRIYSVADMVVEQLQKKIENNPLWGNIVCTCEMISEAEIVEAITRGAKSVDAIKRRTRAGMGSCQLSYCRLRIARILSRELKIPLNQVVKESIDSKLYDGFVRGEKS
jgi:glycerol-3-phosphate dehydrogenase